MPTAAPVKLKSIGTVTHFYDRIGVAVIKLKAALKVGDIIHFSRKGEELFCQPVESIQIDHETLKAAKKGQEIGLKVTTPVQDGADVLK
ncbi:hypothetical protein COU80_03865 [Candidatus Peregrinibacteria bacterium CG10_big_fil_rev_8_21_14_0_10_55_24]|nr:MAG: hypothetical protein COU80_03865 [Candidatus Peregrinibacteria bacterium CG10_big_fil_rev_8_21_14_0_10_55_24]